MRDNFPTLESKKYGKTVHNLRKKNVAKKLNDRKIACDFLTADIIISMFDFRH